MKIKHFLILVVTAGLFALAFVALSPSWTPLGDGIHAAADAAPAGFPLASLAILPALAVIPRSRGRKQTSPFIHHGDQLAFGGERLTAYNSEPAPEAGAGASDAPDPGAAPSAERFVVLNAEGQEIGHIPSEQITAMNASSAASQAVSESLTSFGAGYPADSSQEDLDFLLPVVPTPMAFQYSVMSKLNAFAIEEDDSIGPDGIPRTIKLEGRSRQSAIHTSRGLEVAITEDEMALTANDPTWTEQDEENDKAKTLLRAIRKGKLKRALVIAAAAAGNATAVSWGGAAARPDIDLKTAIDAVALACGDRSMVRVMFGSTAWTRAGNSALLATGTNGAVVAMTRARIAELIQLPEANIRVSYNQYATTKSKKGGAATVDTAFFVGDDVYVFAANQQADRNDPSWGKMFVNRLEGQTMRGYTYNPHPTVKKLGYKYRNKPVATNTSAIKRLTVSLEA